MILEAAKCPNCDANIELDAKTTYTICNYCGSNIFVKGAIEAYKEDQKKERRLKMADECFEKGITEEAEDIYKEISKKFPNDYRGWWGIIKCAPIHSYLHGEMKNEYKRALAFAPENIKPEILENQKLRNLYISKGDKLKRVKQIEKETNITAYNLERNDEKINEDLKVVNKYKISIAKNRVPLLFGLCFIVASAIMFFSSWLSLIGAFIGIALIKHWNDGDESRLVSFKEQYENDVSRGEAYRSRLLNNLTELENERNRIEAEIKEIDELLNL